MVVGIKCSSDGYPSHTGYILSRFYNNRERVLKLISYGDIICIDRKIFPERDILPKHSFLFPQDHTTIRRANGFNEVNTRPYRQKLESLKNSSDVEYIYVYTKESVWKCFDSCMRNYLGITGDVAKNLKDKFTKYNEEIKRLDSQDSNLEQSYY